MYSSALNNNNNNNNNNMQKYEILTLYIPHHGCSQCVGPYENEFARLSRSH